MTNFDFLKNEPKFNTFSDVAISAEKILLIDYSASIINCRRAMEFAIKWMYSVDRYLVMPWDDKLVSLMSTDEFRDIVDADLLRRMEFIRKTGNYAAHAGKKLKYEQAELCLENLYIFMDFVAYCYADEYEERAFDLQCIPRSFKINRRLLPFIKSGIFGFIFSVNINGGVSGICTYLFLGVILVKAVQIIPHLAESVLHCVLCGVFAL